MAGKNNMESSTKNIETKNNALERKANKLFKELPEGIKIGEDGSSFNLAMLKVEDEKGNLEIIYSKNFFDYGNYQVLTYSPKEKKYYYSGVEYTLGVNKKGFVKENINKKVGDLKTIGKEISYGDAIKVMEGMKNDVEMLKQLQKTKLEISSLNSNILQNQNTDNSVQNA